VLSVPLPKRVSPSIVYASPLELVRVKRLIGSLLLSLEAPGENGLLCVFQ
jgi:hypothetical protein